MRGEPVPAARGLDVALVREHLRARQPMQPGHVVFVHVAEHDELGRFERLADALGDQRRVEGRARVAAAHEHLIAVGILAVLLAEEHANASEIGVRRRAHRSLIVQSPAAVAPRRDGTRRGPTAPVRRS